MTPDLGTQRSSIPGRKADGSLPVRQVVLLTAYGLLLTPSLGHATNKHQKVRQKQCSLVRLARVFLTKKRLVKVMS